LQLPAEEFLQSGGIDAEYVEAMIQKRINAKKAKDFATADGVRDELLAQGIVLRDGPEGTSWTQQAH
jgi:cysteinyl-tRNA synthetase